jgi:hypothetical protein
MYSKLKKINNNINITYLKFGNEKLIYLNVLDNTYDIYN